MGVEVIRASDRAIDIETETLLQVTDTPEVTESYPIWIGKPSERESH